MVNEITMAEAEHIVTEHLEAKVRAGAPEVVVLKEQTMEPDFGWVFFYQSKRYLETGNFSDILAGNAPLVVTKSDGRLHVTGTAYSIEHYLQKFVAYKG